MMIETGVTNKNLLTIVLQNSRGREEPPKPKLKLFTTPNKPHVLPSTFSLLTVNDLSRKNMVTFVIRISGSPIP